MSAGSIDQTPSGTVRYEAVPGWGAGLPEMRGRDISDVTVGPDDDVYLLYRDPAMVVVCDPEGRPRTTIGHGVIHRPHGVHPGHDATLVVDEIDHVVRVFDGSGRQRQVIGGGPSDPTFPTTGLHVERITRPLPPMTRPTRVAQAPWGDLYVSDGYGNCRVHRYRMDGTLIQSWGEPGTGPGQFHIPHSVTVDREGRVLVCDRENDRIQVFTAEGAFLGMWTDIRRPQAVAHGGDGLYYVAEGAWKDGQVTLVHGAVSAAPSRVSVLDGTGRVVRRTGGEQPPAVPGNFVSAHSLGVDSNGDLYVAECVASLLANAPDAVTPDRPAVQKLRRVVG